MVGRSSVDASAYAVKALGFRGCLALTVCTCTAIVILQVNVNAIFQTAALESTKQATARWTFQLASDSMQTLLLQKASTSGVQGVVALIR